MYQIYLGKSHLIRYAIILQIYEFTIVQILLWRISYKTMVCNLKPNELQIYLAQSSQNTSSRIFRLNLLQMRILQLYWYIMTMQFNLDLIFQYVALFMACDLIYYANLSLLSILIVLLHPDWNFTADISFIYFLQNNIKGITRYQGS